MVRQHVRQRVCRSGRSLWKVITNCSSFCVYIQNCLFVAVCVCLLINLTILRFFVNKSFSLSVDTIDYSSRGKLIKINFSQANLMTSFVESIISCILGILYRNYYYYYYQKSFLIDFLRVLVTTLVTLILIGLTKPSLRKVN